MCESVFKVLLIGDHSVGKTTFVASYVLNKWVPNLKTTVGGREIILLLKSFHCNYVVSQLIMQLNR